MFFTIAKLLTAVDEEYNALNLLINSLPLLALNHREINHIKPFIKLSELSYITISFGLSLFLIITSFKLFSRCHSGQILLGTTVGGMAVADFEALSYQVTTTFDTSCAAEYALHRQLTISAC